MKKIIMTLSFLFLLLCFANVTKAEDLVTVQLKNNIGNKKLLHIRIRGDYFTPDLGLSIKDKENYQLVVKNGALFLKDKKEIQKVGSSLILTPQKYDTNHLIFINGTPYLGAMEFVIEENKIVRPINQLPLEDYLKGVVPFEVYPSWNMEALKAQSLAARTYAVSHMNRDMVDTIEDQVYGGFVWNVRTTQAVDETRGEVITYHQRLIDAFYSASNGGMTENNAHVWGGKARPFYPIKKDPYDPEQPWSFSFHQTQISETNAIQWDKTNERDKAITDSIKAWLQNKGYGQDIKILSIPHFEVDQKRNKADRALTGSITVEFLQRLYGGLIHYEEIELKDVPLNSIRPIFGGHRFKSYLVDNAECDGQICTVEGRGFGHGVGMSQWGASIMGDKGNNYKEIIQFYFPGTKISNISDIGNGPSH
jgi:stage II sporulation protein D